MAQNISVSGLVMSMALVVGVWLMSWGSSALGPGLALCGALGIVASIKQAISEPADRNAQHERKARERSPAWVEEAA